MTVITALVAFNGVPYNGCPVTFTVDKSNIAYLPVNNTNITGPDGKTLIYLTSNDTSGTVIVTAEAKVPNSTGTVKASITVTVLDWGAIGGTVFNQASVPMTGVRVTLKNESGNVYRIYENPQNTSTTAPPIGTFVFYRIPAGKYSVSWNADGMSESLPVTVSPGTATVIFNENRSFQFPDYKDAPTGYTTLYGYVLDKVKNGVPSTPVVLYNTVYNGSGKTWDTLTPVAQTMSNKSLNYSGLYSFSNVPYGTYKVVANRIDAAANNHTYYSIVTLNNSGQVGYIVIPDLAPHHPFPPTLTPSATPSLTAGNATATQTGSGMTVPVVIGTFIAAGLLLFVLRRTPRR